MTKYHLLRKYHLIVLIFVLSVFLLSCAKGNEFVGKWQRADSPLNMNEIFEISRNGSNFILKTDGQSRGVCILKDGVLHFDGYTIGYVEKEDMLIQGNSKYKRIK